MDGRDTSLLWMEFVRSLYGLELFTRDKHTAGSGRRGMEMQTIDPFGFVFSSKAGHGQFGKILSW